jgi:predicted nucleic acid-binding protein
MKKPTLYFDTNIFSAYWYSGDDVAMLARRMHTREWWDSERKHFSLWASAFGEMELRAGQYPRQLKCLSMHRRLRYLPITNPVTDLMAELLERGLVPESKPGDAAHLAISTSHGIDYLLTWNYAHMANANVQDRLESLCEELDLVAPLMVSPESIPQDRFGQSIRRRK